MPIESVSLRYVGGSSNKVYNMQLEQVADMFEVTAQNGRYGGTLTARKITKTLVDYNTAKDTYDKKLKEKLSEGYTPDGSGTPFAGTDKAGEVTGNIPQLLNPVKEAELERYIADDDWMAEEKKDGHHIMVEVDGNGNVTGSNRRGLAIAISSVIEKDARVLLPDGGTLDGEGIGDAYHVFDLLRVNGLDMRPMGAYDRHRALVTLFGMTKPKDKARLVTAVLGTVYKRRFLEELRIRRAEGIVFKRMAAPYIPGKPNSAGDMIKFKFLGSATCVVEGSHKTKRSVRIAVADGDGLVSVGNVTIPSNRIIPADNALVEVEYLHAFPGGALYQTTYKGLRLDKTEPDQYSTLKFKGEETDEA